MVSTGPRAISRASRPGWQPLFPGRIAPIPSGQTLPPLGDAGAVVTLPAVAAFSHEGFANSSLDLISAIRAIAPHSATVQRQERL